MHELLKQLAIKWQEAAGNLEGYTSHNEFGRTVPLLLRLSLTAEGELHLEVIAESDVFGTHHAGELLNASSDMESPAIPTASVTIPPETLF